MSKRLRGLVAALGGLGGLAVLVLLGLMLMTLFGAQGGVPVAQGPSLPTATETLGAYPPPPPTPAPTPLPTSSPSPTVLPAPVLKAVPVPKEVLAGEKIAFLRDQDVWLVNVASRALAQVTVSGNVAHIYGWSHDGSQLLLGVGEWPVLPETDIPRGTDLWVLDIRGSRAVQLTRGLEARRAAWSPVSDQIAYTVKNDGLYIVSSDGTKLRKAADKAIQSPVWSPNGMKIAFILPPPTWEGGLVEAYDIAVLNLADGSIAQLTSQAWTNFHPVWSLDGKRILFESDREHAPDTGLWYTMNTDGSGLRHLEKPALLSATNVDGSPIADLVAFDVGGDIWVMDFNGSASKVVEGFDPSWSSNGSRLVYIGKDGGIWVIDVASKDAKQLTASGSQPHWSN